MIREVIIVEGKSDTIASGALLKRRPLKQAARYLMMEQ